MKIGIDDTVKGYAIVSIVSQWILVKEKQCIVVTQYQTIEQNNNWMIFIQRQIKKCKEIVWKKELEVQRSC